MKQKSISRDNRVILPIGATEEHGRHLGLGTDHIEAEAIAHGVGETTNVAVAPTLNYGMSHSLFGFPGTISLRPTRLIAVLDDLFRSLSRHGFRRVFVVNRHGGNPASLLSTVQTLAPEFDDLRVKNFEWSTDQESDRVVIDIMGEQAGSHPSREFTMLNTFAQKYPDGIMGLVRTWQPMRLDKRCSRNQ